MMLQAEKPKKDITRDILFLMVYSEFGGIYLSKIVAMLGDIDLHGSKEGDTFLLRALAGMVDV